MNFVCTDVQGLTHCCGLTTVLVPDGGMPVGLSWSYEMKRAFTDNLCRLRDLQWGSEHVDNLGKKVPASTTADTSVNSHYPSPPLQYLLLGGDRHHRPVALSAIPTKIKQGEEQPASTVPPLSMLPEVQAREICLLPAFTTAHVVYTHANTLSLFSLSLGCPSSP